MVVESVREKIEGPGYNDGFIALSIEIPFQLVAQSRLCSRVLVKQIQDNGGGLSLDVGSRNAWLTLVPCRAKQETSMMCWDR